MKVTRPHRAPRHRRRRLRPDPRPGSGTRPRRRHRGDLARTHQEVERRLYPDVIERFVQENDTIGGQDATVNTKIQRALLSVCDKTGLVELARALHELGVEVVSSGGTSTAISTPGIPVTTVEDVTGVPEMLDGRVKTLAPEDPRRPARRSRQGIAPRRPRNPRHPAVRSRRVEPLPVPRAARASRPSTSAVRR